MQAALDSISGSTEAPPASVDPQVISPYANGPVPLIMMVDDVHEGKLEFTTNNRRRANFQRPRGFHYLLNPSLGPGRNSVLDLSGITFKRVLRPHRYGHRIRRHHALPVARGLLL